METSIDVAGTNSALLRWMELCWSGLHNLWRTQQKRRSLVVKETASLGERRFVAVVQFERQRFLIGGGAGSVSLLAHLPEKESD